MFVVNIRTDAWALQSQILLYANTIYAHNSQTSLSELTPVYLLYLKLKWRYAIGTFKTLVLYYAQTFNILTYFCWLDTKSQTTLLSFEQWLTFFLSLINLEFRWTTLIVISFKNMSFNAEIPPSASELYLSRQCVVPNQCLATAYNTIFILEWILSE